MGVSPYLRAPQRYLGMDHANGGGFGNHKAPPGRGQALGASVSSSEVPGFKSGTIRHFDKNGVRHDCNILP